MNQKIYKKILESQNVTHYSPGIFFENRLINMEKFKAFSEDNQPENSIKKVVLVRLYQALMGYLIVLHCGYFYSEVQNIGLVDVNILI